MPMNTQPMLFTYISNIQQAPIQQQAMNVVVVEGHLVGVHVLKLLRCCVFFTCDEK